MNQELAGACSHVPALGPVLKLLVLQNCPTSTQRVVNVRVPSREAYSELLSYMRDLFTTQMLEHPVKGVQPATARISAQKRCVFILKLRLFHERLRDNEAWWAFSSASCWALGVAVRSIVHGDMEMSQPGSKNALTCRDIVAMSQVTTHKLTTGPTTGPRLAPATRQAMLLACQSVSI